jgi:MGT family glycosyltransferase
MSIAQVTQGDLLSHIVVCAFSNPGHVTPMLAVGIHLAKLGHTITFHTASVFRQKVENAGLRFVGTSGKADIDYRDPTSFDGRENLTVMDRSNYFLKQTIIEALTDLDRDLRQILKESSVDLILTSSMYFGAFPLLLRVGERRPPVIGCGVNPLMLSSVDCGPLSPPDTTLGGRQRIREANLQTWMAYAPAQDGLNDALKKCSAPALSDFWMDAIYNLPDLVLQFSSETFEFPRSDMPSNLRFVGPILPGLVDAFKKPAWWGELDGSKPVILVTQGTLANRNLDELIQPTLTALANDDVLVIVATGRSDHDGLIVPTNARVESFVPFLHLLPKVDVMVTNGGFGAVQQCLSFGIPLVVGGVSEDKAFTALRLAWSGAGINLKTGRPTADQLHTAIHAVLADQSYQEQAQRIQKDIAQHDPLEEVARHIEAVLAHTKAWSLLRLPSTLSAAKDPEKLNPPLAL